MDIGGDGGIPLGVAEKNDRQQPANLNISDVLEAISLADPTFGAEAAVVDNAMARPTAQIQSPYVRIVEQPASKALRFRYECEGRSAGSIPGVSSTPENRTYPTVKIYGYTGLVTIVVSCVTKDEPYRPHPHNLVGRERCDRGVCTVRTELTDEANEYQFRNLGIQCVKRRDIADALKTREDLRVDPFKTGFGHRNHPQSIDLNAVRLGFQVFLPDSAGKMRRPLAPVVSDIIFDKKAMSDLVIMRASHCSGTAKGGTQVILLCEKVTKEDTAVVFYQQDQNEQVVWEENATVTVVHKQVAIVFSTPPYADPHTAEHVNVHFQLKRLSDNYRSNWLPFEYIPEYQESNYIGSKRRKTLITSLSQSTYEQDRIFQQDQQIKAEPRDKTSPHRMSTSPLLGYAHYVDQNWAMNMEMQKGVVAGPSHMSPFQGIQWTEPTYGQNLSQNIQPGNLQPLSSNMQAPSPNQIMSPNIQVVPNIGQSPMHGGVSPMHGCVSPMGHRLSSMHGGVSPMHGGVSPMHGGVPPMHGGVSPMHVGVSPMGHAMSSMHGDVSPVGHAPSPMQTGHISPNLVQQPTYNQLPQQSMTDSSQQTPSLSALLQDAGDSSLQLNSGELSGLSNLLERNPDLLTSDLNRLSTSDLFI